MSFQVIHVAKNKTGVIRGLQIHNQREKKSLTNPDIDENKSTQNYDLKNNTEINYGKFIKNRIEELKLKRAARSDAVVMVSIIISSDKEFFNNLTPETEKQYFKDAYEFLSSRYGSENVVSSVVHKDEYTPHMHFNFVPVTPDLRLSGKDVINKITLKDLHTDLHNEVSVNYGLERGKSFGEKRKHLSEQEFKLKAKADQIEQEHKERLRQTPDTEIKIPVIHPTDIISKKIGFFKKESKEQVAERLSIQVAKSGEFNNLILALNSSKQDLLKIDAKNKELNQREQEVKRREYSIEETARKTVLEEFRRDYANLREQEAILELKKANYKVQIDNKKEEEINSLKRETNKYKENLIKKDEILQKQEKIIEDIYLELKEEKEKILLKDKTIKFYNLAIKELPRETKLQLNKVLKEIQENPNWEKERSKKQGLSR